MQHFKRRFYFVREILEASIGDEFVKALLLALSISHSPELPPDYGPCVFCLGKNLLVAVIRQRIILNPTCPCCGGIGRVRTHNPR